MKMNIEPIKIDKDIWENLDDEKKFLLWAFQQNDKFDGVIKTFRKALGIPTEGWQDKGYFGVKREGKIPKLKRSVLEHKKALWEAKHKGERFPLSRIPRALQMILQRYQLDDSWKSIMHQIICFNSVYLPHGVIDLVWAGNRVEIRILGYLKSKHQLKNWVDDHWSEIEQLVKKGNRGLLERVPKPEKLLYYQRIVELRDEEGKRFAEIADLLSGEFPELDTEDARINEGSVKNAYHIFKKALTI